MDYVIFCVPGRGNTNFKGPKVGMCLGWLKNKGTSKSKISRGEEVRDEIREKVGAQIIYTLKAMLSAWVLFQSK